MRPGVTDPAVDDRDLAVVSEVKPRGAAPEESRLQHRPDLNALAPQPGRQLPQAVLRADGVHQHPARNTAPRRADQGLTHALPGGIGIEDVEEQVGALSRSINIRNQTVYGASVIGQQLDRITGGHLEIAELLSKVGDGLEIGWKTQGSGSGRPPLRLDFADLDRGAFLHLDPALRQVDAAEQRVKHQAGPGHKEDEQQPCAGRGCASALRHINEHHEPNEPLAAQI